MSDTTTGSPKTKQRVIKVDAAIRCCKLAQDMILAELNQVGEAIGAGGDPNHDLAYAPAPIPGIGIDRPRIIRVPSVGVGLGVGAILILAANELASIEEAYGLQRFGESLHNVTTAVQRRLNDQPGSCADCMMKRALQQKNPRTWVKTATGHELHPRT